MATFDTVHRHVPSRDYPDRSTEMLPITRPVAQRSSTGSFRLDFPAAAGARDLWNESHRGSFVSPIDEGRRIISTKWTKWTKLRRTWLCQLSRQLVRVQLIDRSHQLRLMTTEPRDRVAKRVRKTDLFSVEMLVFWDKCHLANTKDIF